MTAAPVAYLGGNCFAPNRENGLGLDFGGEHHQVKMFRTHTEQRKYMTEEFFVRRSSGKVKFDNGIAQLNFLFSEILTRHSIFV